MTIRTDACPDERGGYVARILVTTGDAARTHVFVDRSVSYNNPNDAHQFARDVARLLECEP